MKVEEVGNERKELQNTYETTELKLAALLLAEIKDSYADVYKQDKSIRKNIIITFPAMYGSDVEKLAIDYLNRRAMVNVSDYNKALNIIRDRLRGAR